MIKEFYSNPIIISNDLTVNENVSSNGIFYGDGSGLFNITGTGIDSEVRGLSSDWNSTYTTVRNSSALEWKNNPEWDSVYSTVNGASATKWDSVYSTVNTSSALEWKNNPEWDSVYSTVNGASATKWDSVYSTVNGASATKWDNVYSTVNTSSALEWKNKPEWDSVYSTVNGASATKWDNVYTTVRNSSALEWDNKKANEYTHLNFLPLSGGTITNNLTALSTVFIGDGVVEFIVTEEGMVGIGIETPNEKLTINGVVSSNDIIYALNGNSNNWNNVYSIVETYSSSNWDNTNYVPSITSLAPPSSAVNNMVMIEEDNYIDLDFKDPNTLYILI